MAPMPLGRTSAHVHFFFKVVGMLQGPIPQVILGKAIYDKVEWVHNNGRFFYAVIYKTELTSVIDVRCNYSFLQQNSFRIKIIPINIRITLLTSYEPDVFKT